MTFNELSRNLQNAMKQVFGAQDIIENNLASYEIEGESIITINDLKVPSDLTQKELDVLKEIYAEYKIYTCMGHEIIAQQKQSDFYKVIKALKERKEANKTEKKASKGLMIFNG